MTVELLRSMGSDLDIVNAARVSLGKESKWERFCSECGVIDPLMMHSADKTKPGIPGNICPGYTDHRLKTADAGLINYLMKNRHGTPFEMVVFTFRVKCPIGVSREWMRHRIGSFNEVSTRYVEMEPEFYVPPPEAVRRQVGKPGHYTFEAFEPSAAVAIAEGMQRAYDAAHDHYRVLLELGVAKELARNVLPLGLMTQFIWTVNLRSLLNFLSLRTAPSALLEIRTEAGVVDGLAQTVVPVAMAAWNANGRCAP